jgi:hypothetical protein
MKSLIAILFILFGVLVIISCKKPPEAPKGKSAPSIIGHWSLVSDSIYLVILATPIIDTLQSKYSGVPTDYYNFAPDGKLYTNEGTYGLDTATYTIITSGSKLSIDYTVSNRIHAAYGWWNSSVFTVITLTDHALKLSVEDFPAPFVRGNVINLAR